ncbi:MAG: putative hydrolase YxeP [Firmicutes bacterium ADurb.BinA052]|nr:MAG: putative hydrolase YxeP [Firmicutes bacterium ADurb.BinA052]
MKAYESSSILARANAEHAHMVEARRAIHYQPELGFEEHATAQLIADRLQALGLEVKTGVGGTGVVAVLRGGGLGPTVALRADMDALPVSEETGLPYASVRPGLMHACAHDMHCAVLLGVAAVLKECISEFRGTVVFMFQPAEETDGGARAFIDAGVLAEYEPDAVFGLHMWPDLAVGKVGIQPGPVMASLDSFDIELTGSTAHGAMPHRGRDAVLAASSVVLGLQQIVSRNVDPMEAAVVTVGTLHSGKARNIIADHAALTGTVRALGEPVRELVASRIQEVVAKCSGACDVESHVKYDRLLPTLMNDRRMSEIAAGSARAVLGPECIEHSMPSMAADDFSLYAEKVPGCYVFFGCTAAGNTAYPLHNGHFAPNEDALPAACAVMARLCIDYSHCSVGQLADQFETARQD